MIITIGSDPVLRAPVDRVAARVIRPGVKYEPAKRIQTADQPTPFQVVKLTQSHLRNPSFKDFTGRRVGRLTVYGLSTDSGRWACRCDCGTYTLRTAKSIRNPNNATIDRCEHCRHLACLQREDHYRQTGRNKPPAAPAGDPQ